MSYLYTLGKTPAAINLALILDELADNRLSNEVRHLIHAFYLTVKELDNVSPVTALRVMRPYYADIRRIVKSNGYPRSVESHLLSVLSSKHKAFNKKYSQLKQGTDRALAEHCKILNRDATG